MASQSDNEVKYSEPAYTGMVDRAKQPFYRPNIDKKLVAETRELLEKYSHIPPSQQSAHVHKIRDMAYDIRGYPCTGLGAFLIAQLCMLPIYPEVLSRAKAGETLMDVGCLLGTDLRRLVYDGAPSTNLYAVDIASHWDVGFEMYRDRSHFHAKFIEADVLSDTNPDLLALKKNKVDIISVLQVLHQWRWDGQVQAAKVLVEFTKPGSLIVGNQMGNSRAHEIFFEQLGIRAWRHNPETLARFWEQVGEETGTKWESEARLKSFEEMGFEAEDGAWMEDGICMIEFEVRRIQ